MYILHLVLKTVVDFNEGKDYRVAVASTGPYTNYLHLTPGRYLISAFYHSIFTGKCSLFLMYNLNCQNIENSSVYLKYETFYKICNTLHM